MWYEDTKAYQWFRLILRLASDLGGLIVVLYLLLLSLTTLCTRGKMEDYLVSELLHEAELNDLDYRALAD